MVTTGVADSRKDKPLLPDAFAGWDAAEKPEDCDRSSATGQRECRGAEGIWLHGRHRQATTSAATETLSVQALSFQDVSGAYGAYSFYRQNGWPKADIGTGATSDNNRVLFWKGNTVVDATFSHVGPMSAAELRELAEGSADRRRETGRCRRRSWPACHRTRWISRRRILRRDRRAMRERAACCRRNWWDSIAMRRP